MGYNLNHLSWSHVTLCYARFQVVATAGQGSFTSSERRSSSTQYNAKLLINKQDVNNVLIFHNKSAERQCVGPFLLQGFSLVLSP